MSTFSIGGIASGLDTLGIIDQLMEVERQPVRRMQSRQSSLRRMDDAWGAITTRLSSLRTALGELDDIADVAGLSTATSSAPDDVVATVTGTPGPGSLSLVVDQLATTQQMTGLVGFAAADAAIGDGTSLTITDAGGAEVAVVDLAGGTRTLAEVAAELDQVDGIRAQVLKVADGDHRLALSSERTGTANAFTLSSDASAFDPGAPGTWTTVGATDALMTVGGVQVSRSSNVVDDLVPGVRLDLRQAGPGAVTITTARDVDAVVSRVSGLVKALNGALGTIANETRYDPDSGARGPLQGNATARDLASDLRATVSGLVAELTGDHRSASSVGIQLTRDGRVELDEGVLREAVASDVDGVAALFARSVRAPQGSAMELVRAADTTAPGTYDVVVSAAATRASATGTTYDSAAAVPPVSFDITTSSGASVTVEVDGDVATTADQAAAAIRAALEAAGVDEIEVGTVATTDGEALTLLGTGYGSSREVTVEHVAGGGGDTSVFGLAGTHAGTDVAGTIDGATAVGGGQSLRSESGPSTGLTVLAPEAGTWALSYSSGLTGALSATLDRYEGAAGRIQLQRDRIDIEIADFDDRIAAFDLRLASREDTLRRQFTAMEAAMQRLMAEGSWLSAQMGSLPTNEG